MDIHNMNLLDILLRAESEKSEIVVETASSKYALVRNTIHLCEDHLYADNWFGGISSINYADITYIHEVDIEFDVDEDGFHNIDITVKTSWHCHGGLPLTFGRTRFPMEINKLKR